MSAELREAPGRPGNKLSWTSAAKTGVGTSIDPSAKVWFTIADGILTEVYYPRIDQACIRDSGFVVTDGKTFFSDEAMDADHHAELVWDGVPAYRLVNTCRQGRYRIEKLILTLPQHAALVQRVSFSNLTGDPLELYAWLTPRTDDSSGANNAWVAASRNMPMLFGQNDQTTVAVVCSAPWLKRSVGYVGRSDGWSCLQQHKTLAEEYDRAEHGDVSMTGQIDLQAANGRFTVAIGCGANPEQAADQALLAIRQPFDTIGEHYRSTWDKWQSTLQPLDRDVKARLFRISAAVVQAHEDKSERGGIVASLSVPWGRSRGENEAMGYQLVWVRDLARGAVGLLAAGVHDGFRRVLDFLRATQCPDGHWAQNMYLDGRAYWHGRQIDETAAPVLLVDAALRRGALSLAEAEAYWPMMRRSMDYVLSHGPVTQQDRWETSRGYSAYSIAVQIAAMLAAADLADQFDQPVFATSLREKADSWNSKIEKWIYATGTAVARSVGVDGYYIRLGPPSERTGESDLAGEVRIQNRPAGQDRLRAEEMVSPDALSLVRYGLRRPDDPRILNTIKLIDATLKVETPFGPSWHRYTNDGYGEHPDGRPYDGQGQGRAWPLLTGERAHYELAAGRRDEAVRLMHAMESFAGPCGMMPEQVWDSQDIPERGLYCGRPTGSAMPLVWTHAEYITLCRSIRDGEIFDRPPQTVKRYLEHESS